MLGTKGKLFASRSTRILLRSMSDAPSSMKLFVQTSPAEYALYGWGSSMMGVGSGLRSKEKMMPRPIIGFDKKIKSLSVGRDHLAAVTGMVA